MSQNTIWFFHCYSGTLGSHVVSDKIENLPVKAKALFERRLAYLKTSPIHQWNKPEARSLEGKDNKGMYEIRFSDITAAYRPMGFFHGNNSFIINVFSTKKDKIYDPKNTFKVNQDRAEAIKNQSHAYSPLKINGKDYSKI